MTGNTILRHKDLSIVEYPEGYMVHLTGDLAKPFRVKSEDMGDFICLDDKGDPIPDHSQAFYAALRKDLVENYAKWLKVYFNVGK